ncbi:hypothetical protein [Clostridium oceanicum]|uniref:Uncharacterized protein n=1 Tax=Clostridium oceanicum TaxID=1543 RepID=A0ABN1JIJ6_9CLOT
MSKMTLMGKEESVIGNNAISINGAITIPDSENKEKFFNDLRTWLKKRGCSFFGYTENIKNSDKADDLAKEILLTCSDIDLDRNLQYEDMNNEDNIISLSDYK